ncbi:MAG TPA: hypothetical protein VIG24_07540 [Acidimicrobiia bacterium]
MQYTDEQVEQVRAAVGYLSSDTARNTIRYLDGAGITLNFPEPRFFAEESSHISRGSWVIRDRRGAGWAVNFGSANGGWNERQAKALAERLNREESA